MVEEVSKDCVQFIRPSILFVGNNIHCFCLNIEEITCKPSSANSNFKNVVFWKLPNTVKFRIFLTLDFSNLLITVISPIFGTVHNFSNQFSFSEKQGSNKT